MKNHIEKIYKAAISHWSDYTGIVASVLCIIHCWALPVIILILPGIIIHNESVHPILGGTAVLSTVPLLLKKSFYRLSVKVHQAMILGIMLLLVMILNHGQFSFFSEVLFNTAGGLLLTFVHYKHLRTRKPHSHKRI